MNSTLSERAMLVDLTIKQWTAGKTDKTASDLVSATYGINKRAGHFYKRLIGADHLNYIRRIANAAYDEHHRRTLPWLDNGHRILSSAGYFDYISAMQRHEADFSRAVHRFTESYPELVQNAAHELQSLFNSADYPRVSEIADKFCFSFTIFPFPSSDDFRVDLDTDETDHLKKMIDLEVSSALSHAEQNLRERIITAVEHMRDRLANYDGTRTGAFRNSLVSNMEELIELIPTLNVTADQDINDISNHMVSLTLYEPDTLRTNVIARNATISIADNILWHMGVYVTD